VTKSKVDTVYKVHKVVDFRLCRQHVAAFYRQHVAAFYRQLGAVNIVGKVERVQLGQLCRKWVIIVARISNVFSTLSSVCMDGTKATQATCRLTTKSTVSLSTVSPVCTSPYDRDCYYNFRVPTDLENQGILLVVRGKRRASSELCDCRDVTMFQPRSLNVDVNNN